MEKLRVYILTEGSSKIGFGHITRCLSLYQSFEDKGIKPKFIINGDESIIELIKNINFELTNWLVEKEKILHKLQNADIVIIDSYLADRKFYEVVSKIVKLPVYYDDNNRIEYPRGVVINGNIHAETLNYPQKEGITYLLGTNYTPLRKEFWDIPEKKIREEIESVMITFGGDDLRNITPKILKLLNDNYPDLKKNVIIGKGFKKIEEIESLANKNVNLIYYPNAKQMKKEMLDSDIAISAGGQTLYELAGVGVPTIAIAVADNQLGNVEGWKKMGFIEYAGWWKDKDILDKTKVCFDKLKDFPIRKKKNLIGKKMVDGKGPENIINSIITKCKNGENIIFNK